MSPSNFKVLSINMLETAADTGGLLGACHECRRRAEEGRAMCDFSGGQSARVASTLSRAARGGQPEGRVETRRSAASAALTAGWRRLALGPTTQQHSQQPAASDPGGVSSVVCTSCSCRSLSASPPASPPLPPPPRPAPARTAPAPTPCHIYHRPPAARPPIAARRGRRHRRPDSLLPHHHRPLPAPAPRPTLATPSPHANTPCCRIALARSAPCLHTARPLRWLPPTASATHYVWRPESLAIAGRPAYRQPGQ